MPPERNFQKDDRLSFRCKTEVREALEKAANNKGLSVSAMALEIITHKLTKQGLLK